MTPKQYNEMGASGRSSQLQARYLDLLDAARDEHIAPTDEGLIHTLDALDALYTIPTAPQRLARFERVQRPISFTERVGRFAPRRLLREPDGALRTMPRWVAIVTIISLLAVLGASGAAYALSPMINQPLEYDPGAQQALSDNLFTQINQTQTAMGYDLTLEKGYADANNIIVVYTVTVDGSHLVGRPDIVSGTSPTVTTAQGATVHWVRGEGSDFQGGVQSVALWFDAAPAMADDGVSVIGGGQTLHLQFHSAGIRVLAPSGDVTFLKAPMTFTFALPLRPSRVALPHLAARSAGVTVTLDTVVVSDTATRFYLGGLTNILPGKYGVGNFAPSLAFDGRTISLRDLGQGSEARHGSYDVIEYANSFERFHGRWTLTLTSTPASPPALAGGTWVFNFVVP